MDPVTAFTNGDIRHFNRFTYVYNNPYRLTDPDGRCGACDRFGDQYARDAAAGNLAVYEPFEKPVVIATGVMLVGPVVPELASALYAARGSIALSISLMGDPIATIKLLKKINDMRAAIAVMAQQSKRTSEIQKRIKELLALMILLEQAESDSGQEDAEPPPEPEEVPKDRHQSPSPSVDGSDDPMYEQIS